jgi:hypothetical protein
MDDMRVYITGNCLEVKYSIYRRTLYYVGATCQNQQDTESQHDTNQGPLLQMAA